MSRWRQARAIALLPGTVALVVPAVLVATYDTQFDPWRALLGAPLLAGGFAMWLWTVRLFARIGRGTLAPWDPTERLVVEGPLRPRSQPDDHRRARRAGRRGPRLRLDRDRDLGCGLFVVVNHVFFLVYEEPAVERRFGEEYRRYKQNVPRWIPRRTPWHPV